MFDTRRHDEQSSPGSTSSRSCSSIRNEPSQHRNEGSSREVVVPRELAFNRAIRTTASVRDDLKRVICAMAPEDRARRRRRPTRSSTGTGGLDLHPHRSGCRPDPRLRSRHRSLSCTCVPTLRAQIASGVVPGTSEQAEPSRASPSCWERGGARRRLARRRRTPARRISMLADEAEPKPRVPRHRAVDIGDPHDGGNDYSAWMELSRRRPQCQGHDAG